MSRDDWVKHMLQTAGLSSIMTEEHRRSYLAAKQAHDHANCIDCKARLRNIRANRARVEKDQAMRDLGLVKVKGALGGTYYE